MLQDLRQAVEGFEVIINQGVGFEKVGGSKAGGIVSR